MDFLQATRASERACGSVVVRSTAAPQACTTDAGRSRTVSRLQSARDGKLEGRTSTSANQTVTHGEETEAAANSECRPDLSQGFDKGTDGKSQHGKSATTTQRPAFQNMLAYIRSKKGQVGYVVVHDLSRFARNLENQVDVLAELENVGVLLRSVMEEMDETAAGKLMRNIHGTFNQFFSDRNAERTKVGMEKAAKIGRKPSKAPLRYLNVRATRNSANLIPDPERAPLIRKAFELYGAGIVSRA